MENLNAEQIIKALECCKSPKLTKCDGCPREKEDGQCMYRLNEDALALITSQEQRIKELTEENEKIGIENFDLVCELSRIKEDTVRKMQERLKDALNDMSRYDFHGNNNEYFIIGKSFIDQIAKEMLEQ